MCLKCLAYSFKDVVSMARLFIMCMLNHSICTRADHMLQSPITSCDGKCATGMYNMYRIFSQSLETAHCGRRAYGSRALAVQLITRHPSYPLTSHGPGCHEPGARNAAARYPGVSPGSGPITRRHTRQPIAQHRSTPPAGRPAGRLTMSLAQATGAGVGAALARAARILLHC